MNIKFFPQPYIIIAFFVCLERVVFLHSRVSDSVYTSDANGKQACNNIKDVCLQSIRTYYKVKIQIHTWRVKYMYVLRDQSVIMQFPHRSDEADVPLLSCSFIDE